MVGESDGRGFINSIIGYLIVFLQAFSILMIFIYLFSLMLSFMEDDAQSLIVSNNFDQEHKSVNFNNVNFMPFFEIKKFNPNINSTLYNVFKENSSSFDIEKLKKFITFNLIIKIRNQSGSIHYQSFMRECTQEDFKKRGVSNYIFPENNILLCVDPQYHKELFVIENAYANTELRKSFSIEIDRCNTITTPEGCENSTVIENFLKQIYFTQYSVQELIDFGEHEKLNQRPVKTQITFQQQFQLNYNRYRDNNNFIRPNDVETKDSRWYFWLKEQYQFFNLYWNPHWEGEAFNRIIDQYMGPDNTLQHIDKDTLFGSYYFMDDNVNQHQRVTRNILDVLSDLGGFSEFVIIFFSFFSTLISLQYYLGIKFQYAAIISEFIQDIYFPKKYSFKDKSQKMFKFNGFENTSQIFFMKPFIWLFQKNNPNIKLYEYLKYKTESSLDLKNITNRLQKITCLVSVLMNSPEFDKFRIEAEQQYIDNLEDSIKMNDLDVYSYIDSIGHFDLEEEIEQEEKEFKKTVLPQEEDIELTQVQQEMKSTNVKGKLSNRIDSEAENLDKTTTMDNKKFKLLKQKTRQSIVLKRMSMMGMMGQDQMLIDLENLNTKT